MITSEMVSSTGARILRYGLVNGDRQPFFHSCRCGIHYSECRRGRAGSGWRADQRPVRIQAEAIRQKCQPGGEAPEYMFLGPVPPDATNAALYGWSTIPVGNGIVVLSVSIVRAPFTRGSGIL